MKKAKSFRFQRAEGGDALSLVWHVTHKRSKTYVGAILRSGPNNYEVRRPQDMQFHSPLGSRLEAARWLREQFADPAIFDETEPSDPKDSN